jgi:hypothetical protein
MLKYVGFGAANQNYISYGTKSMSNSANVFRLLIEKKLYNIYDEIESRLNLTNVVGNVYLPLFSPNP